MTSVSEGNSRGKFPYLLWVSRTSLEKAYIPFPFPIAWLGLNRAKIELEITGLTVLVVKAAGGFVTLLRQQRK